MKDIALAGPAGVGKDTVARLLVERFGYTRVAFADALKAVLFEANPTVGTSSLRDLVNDIGWEGAKTNPEVRRLLQATGMAVRAIDERFWVRALDEAVCTLPADDPIVVTDMRMPNEMRWCRSVGMLTVRLDRDGVDTGIGWRAHASERSLDGEEFDLYISGDWTPEQAVEQIMEKLMKSTIPCPPAALTRSLV